MASGVSAGPLCVATTRRRPSGESTAPRIVSTPSSIFDVVPMGTRHPPPSAKSIARSALEADGPLAHGRQHPRLVEQFRDAIGEPEPHQPGFGENDAVEVLFG